MSVGPSLFLVDIYSATHCDIFRGYLKVKENSLLSVEARVSKDVLFPPICALHFPLDIFSFNKFLPVLVWPYPKNLGRKGEIDLQRLVN